MNKTEKPAQKRKAKKPECKCKVRHFDMKTEKMKCWDCGKLHEL